MRRTVPAAVTTVLCGLLAACGGQTGEAASSTSASTSSSAAPTTPAEPYDVYVSKDTAHGLTPEVKRDEAVSVAGNTCDNTVTDMTGLLTSIRTITPDDTEYARFIVDRAYFIDAYCPNVRVVYNAAVQGVGLTIPTG